VSDESKATEGRPAVSIPGGFRLAPGWRVAAAGDVCQLEHRRSFGLSPEIRRAAWIDPEGVLVCVEHGVGALVPDAPSSEPKTPNPERRFDPGMSPRDRELVVSIFDMVDRVRAKDAGAGNPMEEPAAKATPAHPAPWVWQRESQADYPMESYEGLADRGGNWIVEGWQEKVWIASPVVRELIRLAPEMERLLREHECAQFPDREAAALLAELDAARKASG